MIAISKANLPLTTIGLAMGGNARIGLEDTIYVRPKELATSNAQLVEQLVGVAKSMNLSPATVEEVVERLKLTPGVWSTIGAWQARGEISETGPQRGAGSCSRRWSPRSCSAALEYPRPR